MDGWYLVKESLTFQLWSVHCTVKSLCGEKEICCHPQGILFAEAISFCQCNTSHVLATEPIRDVFKMCSLIQTASRMKPHIWICSIWSWSHPKVSTHQGSDFLQGRKAAGCSACRSSVPCVNIYHEKSLLELFLSMNIQHISPAWSCQLAFS